MDKEDVFDLAAIDLANPIDVFLQFDLVRSKFRLHYEMPDISDRFNVNDEDLKHSFIGTQRNVLKVTSLENRRQYIAKVVLNQIISKKIFPLKVVLRFSEPYYLFSFYFQGFY